MPRPAPAPKRRSSLTPFYVILGLVLLACIGLLATRLKPGAKEAANQGIAVQLTPDAEGAVQAREPTSTTTRPVGMIRRVGRLEAKKRALRTEGAARAAGVARPA